MRKIYSSKIANRVFNDINDIEDEPLLVDATEAEVAIDNTFKDVELRTQEALEFLKSLPDASVDLLFADPPYFLSNGGTTNKGGKRASVNKGDWDKSKGAGADYDFFYSWIAECQRVLKPSGTIYITGTYHCIYSIGHAMRMLGYNILNDICWFKGNAPPNLSGRQRAAKHETIIWAAPSKGKKLLHTFNYTDMKNANKVYRCSNKNGKRVCGQIINEASANFCWSCGGGLDIDMAEVRQPTSLITRIGTPLPCEKLRGKHPTQKPVKLLKEIIESSSNAGDLVVDPFLGSGTTALVAHILGRRFAGTDLDPKCIEMTKERLSHPEDVKELFND